MFDDLGAAISRALHDAVKRGFVHQFRDRNACDGGIAGKRNHGIAMSAEDEGGYVFDADFKFKRDKSAEACRVKNSGHADYALAGKATDLICGLRHGVQRVRDDDKDGVRRMMNDLADHVVHNFVVGIQKIIAAHARLARDSSGDDDDVGVGGVSVIVSAEDGGVALLDGHGLEEIESLALRNAFDDIDKDDVGEFFRSDPMGSGGAYISRSDDGDFLTHSIPSLMFAFNSCKDALAASQPQK